MTDPTPTRAEVEAAVEKLANSHLGMSLMEWNAVSNTILTCAAENQALRERAEAAEEQRDNYQGMYETGLHLLTAARRAEDAAWNDAIEAAAKEADEEVDRCSSGGAYSIMQETARDVAEYIRALRRAAPTEGET